MEVKWIALPTRNVPSIAQHQRCVEDAVADILLRAELIVPGDVQISGQSQRSDYVCAPNERWDDVVFAADEAERMVSNARQDNIRKRLHGVL